MLPDDQAERIEAGLGSADRATLARWLRLLLDDRRARTALLLGQTRRLSYARKRLSQALAYMDGLLRAAEHEARGAWPDKLPCPHCGAPTAVVKAEQRRQGHAIVHAHPNGVRCQEGSPGPAPPTMAKEASRILEGRAARGAEGYVQEGEEEQRNRPPSVRSYGARKG